MPTDAQLSEAFDMFDTNHSGSIDRTELAAALQGLGYAAGQDEVDEIVARLDADHSGDVSFEEFSELVKDMDREHGTEREILKAFRAFDVRGAGELTVADLRCVADSLGYTPSRVSDDDLREIHHYCAAEDGGRFTLYAWRRAMTEMFDAPRRRPAGAAPPRAAAPDDGVWDALYAEEERMKEQQLRQRREKEAEAAERRRHVANGRIHSARQRDEQQVADLQLDWRERLREQERARREQRDRLNAKRGLRQRQAEEERAVREAEEQELIQTEEQLRRRREQAAADVPADGK